MTVASPWSRSSSEMLTITIQIEEIHIESEPPYDDSNPDEGADPSSEVVETIVVGQQSPYQNWASYD